MGLLAAQKTIATKLRNKRSRFKSPIGGTNSTSENKITDLKFYCGVVRAAFIIRGKL